MDEGSVRKCLQVIARAFTLLVSGGCRPDSFRSVGSFKGDQRRRLFISRAADNRMESKEILELVKQEFRGRFLSAQVGWASLYSIPPEALLVTSSDLEYTCKHKFLALAEQVVIINRFKVAIVVRKERSGKAPVHFLQKYNQEYPRSPVKKVHASDGSLLANLLSQKEGPTQPRRQPHMPPPRPWGLDGELEGAQAGGLEKKVRELLQGVGSYFVSKGVGAEPILFSLPEVYFSWMRRARYKANASSSLQLQRKWVSFFTWRWTTTFGDQETVLRWGSSK